MADVDQRRDAALTLIGGPTKDTGLVTHPDRADTADVIDGQQKIQGVEWSGLDGVA